MLNLSVLMEDSAQKFGNNLAFSFKNVDYTFNEVNSLANKLANALIQIGLLPGQKVAMSCPNSIWFPVIYYAVLKVGSVIVPFNILLKTDEIIHQLEDCQATLYFCYENTSQISIEEYGWDAFEKVTKCKKFIFISDDTSSSKYKFTLQNLLNSQPANFESYTTYSDDTAVIIYTSGTTGKPKGAELSHSNLFCNTVLSADLFAVTMNDKQLVTLPLFHVFGMTVLLNVGLYKAAHSVLIPVFNALEILDIIVNYKITVFAGVPTMYWSLLNAVDSNIQDSEIAKSLRICISGGASLPLSVLEKFEKRFCVKISEGYGMSEGSPVVTFNDIKIGRKLGSIGTAVWGVSVKIIDNNGEELPDGEPGELVYKGHNVMKGYYLRPFETAEILKNGWLHSGDVAIKDKDGFFFIVDRIKDIIIRGGMNVYPREIEELLMRHPLVSLAAVIGVPNEKLGEEIKAFIILNGKAKITKQEIIEWCKPQLANYKYPRLIEFTKKLPVTATGKLLKRELKNI